MKSLLWSTCFVILILLACADLVALWKARSGSRSWSDWLSPFTYGTQAAFAVFAALYIAPRAFEGFSLVDAVMIAELVFLALMITGFYTDLARKRRDPGP